MHDYRPLCRLLCISADIRERVKCPDIARALVKGERGEGGEKGRRLGGGGRAVVELSKRGRLVCAYQSAVSYASPRVSRVALVRAPLRKDDHTKLAGCLLLGHLERPVGDFGMYRFLPVCANRNVLAKENGWTPWGLVDMWASWGVLLPTLLSSSVPIFANLAGLLPCGPLRVFRN